jgi:outer membrane protein, multidrug efflux system
MKKIQNNIISLLIIALIFAGCMVGKNYNQQYAPANIHIRNAAQLDSTKPLAWFDIYHDTVLQRMIKITLDSNRDLLAAAQRIEESRYIVGQVKSNLFPGLNYSAQAGGGSAGTEAQKVTGGFNSAVFNAFAVFNWELDLWGKIRRSTRSAVDEMLANEATRNALQVSLIAEVASDYFLLRDLDNRLMISRETLESRKINTRLNTEKFEKGYVSEMDKLWAVQQQAVAAAAVPTFQRQINDVENALRLLMALGPGPVDRGQSNFDQTLSPDIPVGLPSQLMERRPDILASEFDLAAQFERIGVAQASLFPSISLTGLLGFASPQLSTFISGQSLVANGFGNIAGPIFNFNRLKRQVDVEKSRTYQLYQSYQQTVLRAFGEVDNALASYRGYYEEFEQRKIQVASAARALYLSQARYDNGYTSYLEVVVQQDNLFDAQLLESISLAGKLASIVSLYKALGGGWNMPH